MPPSFALKPNTKAENRSSMRVSVTILQYEHGIIRQVMDVLAELAKREEPEKHRAQARGIVEFSNDFIDRFHHAKEERFLFPEGVKEKAISDAELQRLLADHRKAREMIADLREQVDTKRKLGKAFATAAKEFSEHMAAHVRHEEDSVFPTFEEAIDMDRDMELAEEYERFAGEFGADFSKRAEDFSVKVQDEVLGPGYFKGIG